jgi:hypothetical protein
MFSMDGAWVLHQEENGQEAEKGGYKPSLLWWRRLSCSLGRKTQKKKIIIIKKEREKRYLRKMV